MDHRTRQELVGRLARDAEVLATRFGLEYRVIEADRASATSRYGICYSDGTIRVRLRHASTGRPLKYSSLVNTLCHELAHLRHFNHGPRFKDFYLRILGFARERGIYSPGRGEAQPVEAPPARPPGAVQLELFGLEEL